MGARGGLELVGVGHWGRGAALRWCLSLWRVGWSSVDHAIAPSIGNVGCSCLGLDRGQKPRAGGRRGLHRQRDRAGVGRVESPARQRRRDRHKWGAHERLLLVTGLMTVSQGLMH
eukprot:scaffold648017_cov38-Prasinocladus_malaysianus.AAC.1